jgi:DNA ligase-1
MLYSRVVDAYDKIGSTTSRKDIRQVVVELLCAAPVEVLPKLVYLTCGKLHAPFEAGELGLAERLAARAVALAARRPPTEVLANLAASGDLGATTEHLLLQTAPTTPTLTVQDVCAALEEIARTRGEGAITRKIDALAALLRKATAHEARYLIRTATGRLGLGVGEMTLVTALAALAGDTTTAARLVRRAFDVSSNLGAVAEALSRHGLSALAEFSVQPFTPVRPMLPQGMTSAADVLARLGNSCAAEYKYDGLRLQIHKHGSEVQIFSGHAEIMTDRFPDAVELARAYLRARSAILDAEGVARDSDTGELLPFQEVLRRKRTHGVDALATALPVTLMAFDLLYVDGEDLTQRPYPQRRACLEAVIDAGPRVQVAARKVVERVPDLEAFFDLAVSEGTEGLVCKSVGSEAIYQSGRRGWLWVKLKREFQSMLTDRLNLTAVGAFNGRGKRAGMYGSLLLAAYDPATGMFQTVTKCGAGFTEDDLIHLRDRFSAHVPAQRPANIDARLEADVWFRPSVVLEVGGDELTLSPIHTAARGNLPSDRGLAIRFPRFSRWRGDLTAEHATTVEYLLAIYEREKQGIERTFHHAFLR